MNKIRILLADTADAVPNNNGLESPAGTGEKSPDVVFVDVRMPRRSGLESIREIKRRYPSTKVFLMSFENRKIGKLFQSKDVDGFIDKASMKESLVSVLSVERARLNTTG